MSQDTGRFRSTLDKYYTSPIIVSQCMNLLCNHIQIDANDLCIEPSAGNGSFIESIKEKFKYFNLY